MHQRLPETTLMAACTQSKRKLCGLLLRKERWVLSWYGWLVAAGVILTTSYVIFAHIHPFLAVTHRANTSNLVVEGWVPRYVFRAAAREFKNGAYERIFTTGGPESGNGGYVNDYQTMASAGAEALKKLKVPESVIQMAPSRVISRERTYSSAVALRDWLYEHGEPVQSMNVVTEECHARRTQLLFQEAFGKNVQVGVIAISNPDYNPRQWWHYSDGVREVISESIAYVYARFFFYPPGSLEDEQAHQRSQASR
jgi:uncharacterized SAM-binding protein YcdF (DUF218 family)